MPDGIRTTSLVSSLLLSLSLVRHTYVLEIHDGVDFVVGFTLIGLVLAALAADVSHTVSVVGSVSNIPDGIGTTLTSSAGVLLGCFWLFFVIFLMVKLRTV